MSKRTKPLPGVIDVAYPEAARRRSLIVLNAEDEDSALKIAHKFAEATGCAVTVRDADMIEIETIPAPVKQ